MKQNSEINIEDTFTTQNTHIHKHTHTQKNSKDQPQCKSPKENISKQNPSILLQKEK